MSWTIWQAGLADVDRLALVGSVTFLETFAGVLDGEAIVDHCQREHSSAAYHAYLSSGAISWLVGIEPGSAPIGFSLVAASTLPGSADDKSDLELKRIYTLSRFHGAGVGSALMEHAIDYAAQQGYRRLLLGVYAGNERARAFYAKHGFSQVAIRKFRVGNRNYDDVVLARTVP